MQHASLIKRFAAILYEALSLIAIWLFLTFIFVLLFGVVDTTVERLLLQCILWVVTGAYFIVCWLRSGQTLAMQAWNLKLVKAENQPLDVQSALLRYGLVTISLGVFGVGFWWAFIDKEQLFLHDRLLKTRLMQAQS